jgi:hypothetical protein
MADFEWDKPQQTNIPDWDKESLGKSIAKRAGDPSWAQQMGGLAVGAGTEVLGAPGDIQEQLRNVKHWASKKTGIPESPITFPTMPTSRELRESVKGTSLEPDPRTKFMQKTGEVAADIGMTIPGGYRGLGKVVGETTAESERIAQAAEKLGFKLSPSQVRADKPVAEKGALFAAKDNQRLANQLASRGTGVQVNEVTGDFIGKRIKELGKKFDEVYQGKTLRVDPSVEPHLENIIAREQELGFAGVTPVRQAAATMLENIKSGYVQGDDVQRLRNALTATARSTDNRGKAHEIYELVDVLDRAIEGSNKGMAAKLSVIRPQYRNTIILEDLYNSGGIKGGNVSLERLGNVVGDKNTLRRGKQDIDTLGEMGRELGLRARWETAGEEVPGVVNEAMRTHGPLVTAIKRTLGAPLRSGVARKAQIAAQREAPATQKLAEALGASTPIVHLVRPRDKNQ